MTNTSKTIVFFGTDDFSAASLRELLAKGFTIGAVVTKPDTQKGRGRVLTKPVVKEIAEAHGIAVLQPNNLSEIVDEIKKFDSPIGVLVSFGKIIPAKIIELFTPGIVNVHPSLLPKYRGPSPIESAILHGDTETGVTIMQLSEKMDAGPIYSQVKVPLHDTETAPELEKQLAELGAHQLSTTLLSIMNGSTHPTPQDDSVATYCQLLSKNDSLLDPSTLSASQAERRIRAYLAFPKTKVNVTGHEIIVTKAHVSSEKESPLSLACNDGRYLTIDELISPNGKATDAKSFINGYLKQA